MKIPIIVLGLLFQQNSALANKHLKKGKKVEKRSTKAKSETEGEVKYIQNFRFEGDGIEEKDLDSYKKGELDPLDCVKVDRENGMKPAKYNGNTYATR